MSWKEWALDDLCSIQSGGTPRRNVVDYYEGVIPWAKIADITFSDGIINETEEYITDAGLKAIGNRLFPKGTLLLAMYGSVGKTAVANVDLATNQAILGLQIRDSCQLDGRYLLRYLESIQTYLLSIAQGVTQKNLSATIIRSLKLKIPPLEQQKRIAAILDKADELRIKRRRAIAKLDELLKSVFLELFGDPVANPKGWPSVPLSNTADIVSGVTKGRKLSGKQTVFVPYMRVANVQDGKIILDDVKNIEVLPEDVVRYQLEVNDILLTEGGDPDKLGRGAIWYGEVSPCIHQNHVFRVRLSTLELLPDYLSALIGSSYGKRYFLRAAKQTTGIATINSTQLKAFPVLKPSKQLQEKYRTVKADIEKSKKCGAIGLEKLDTLFASLQARAFSGDLTPDALDEVEAVAAGS